MTMDKGEILRDYKSAKDKAAQVKILADLNDCTPAEIVGIIAGQIPSKRSISKLIKRYGCEPPVAQTSEQQKRWSACAVRLRTLKSAAWRLTTKEPNCTALSRNYWGCNQYE